MLIPTPSLTSRSRRDLSRLDGLHQRLADEIARPARYTGTLRRLARAASVEASTSIEGYRMALPETAAVLAGQEPPGDDEARQAIAAYGRAMDHVLVLADDPHFSWSLRLLLDLHFDACGWQWDRTPGRLRTAAVQVTGPAGGVRYAAPPPEAVPGLMTELVRYLAGDEGHPVVRAAMAHLHLASIHPFRDGSGRVARILQSLVLARGGVLSPEFGSIEPYLAAHTGDYFAALEAAQGGRWDRWGTADGWLRLCLRAHLDQAEARLATLADASRRWAALEAVIAERRWPERMVIALEQAAAAGGVTRGSYASEAAVSAATASADLRRLLDAGLLTQEGRGRTTRYLPGPAARA